MDSVVNEHKKKDRQYPRPEIDCPDCGDKVIICWGEKIDPYLRHVKHKDEKIKCKPSVESWTHSVAKSRLCQFLNEGGICVFNHFCQREQRNIELPSQIKYATEVTFGSSRLDIGGTDEDGRIVVDIEIYHTHKTTNVEDRKKILWVEVEGIEVLDKLDKQEKPVKIILKDLAQKTCCQESVIEAVSKLQNASKPVDYFSLPQEARKKLAIRLGYMYRTITHRAELIRKLAVTTKAIKLTEKWVVTLEENPPNYVWKEFLEYRKCLYCGCECKTSRGNHTAFDVSLLLKTGRLFMKILSKYLQILEMN
jgi:hypothetical protein